MYWKSSSLVQRYGRGNNVFVSIPSFRLQEVDKEYENIYNLGGSSYERSLSVRLSGEGFSGVHHLLIGSTHYLCKSARKLRI